MICQQCANPVQKGVHTCMGVPFDVAVKAEMEAKEILQAMGRINVFGLNYEERLDLANRYATAQAEHMAAKRELDRAILIKSQEKHWMKP